MQRACHCKGSVERISRSAVQIRGQPDAKDMLARLHHYEELADHVEFFRTLYGRCWERWLMKRVGTYLDEIPGVLRRKRSFNRTLLPRLRRLRGELFGCLGTYNLAEPPPATDRPIAALPIIPSDI